MEFGKIRDDGITAHYASEVRIDSFEELSRFYDRVNQWARSSGLVIGEGTIAVIENITENPWPYTFVLLAPLIEGDPEKAFYINTYQTSSI